MSLEPTPVASELTYRISVSNLSISSQILPAFSSQYSVKKPGIFFRPAVFSVIVGIFWAKEEARVKRKRNNSKDFDSKDFFTGVGFRVNSHAKYIFTSIK